MDSLPRLASRRTGFVYMQAVVELAFAFEGIELGEVVPNSSGDVYHSKAFNAGGIDDALFRKVNIWHRWWCAAPVGVGGDFSRA